MGLLKRIKKLFGKLQLVMIALFLVSFLLQFFPGTKSFWWTGPFPNSGFFISPFTLQILLIILLVILLSLDFKSNSIKATTIRKWLYTILSYFIIGLTGVGSILFIHYIYTVSGLNLELHSLYKFNFSELALLSLFITIFANYLFLSHLLYKVISKIQAELKVKISGIVVSIVFLGSLLLTFGTTFNIIALILAFLILITLLDLYQDRRSLTSTWIFSWMILFAAFLSFIVFDLDYKFDLQNSEKKLALIIKERNPDFEQAFVRGLEHDNIKEQVYNINQLSIVLSSCIELNDSLFFNPISGDYHLIVQNIQDSAQIRHAYTDRSELSNEKNDLELSDFFILHNDSVIINRTEHSNARLFDMVAPEDESIFDPEPNGIKLLINNAHSGLTLYHLHKLPGLLKPISLFSLFFFMLSVILLIYSWLESRYKLLSRDTGLRFLEKRTLRNKIQLSIIGLLILAFFVVGMTSNYYLQDLSDETAEAFLMKESSIIKAEMQDYCKTVDSASVQELKIFASHKRYSKGINVQVYENTRNINYQKENLSPHHQELLKKYKIDEEQLINIFDQLTVEKVNDQYTVRNNSNHLLFFPFFNLKSNTVAPVIAIEQSPNGAYQSGVNDIFVTFLNIYSLLFIFSGFIAIALANSISNPIELLGQRLKGLKLSKKNETVEWDNEDEIGDLIGIYNEMIHKLSDSAKVMAKVERDSAWKEMAKQVAHEIKNPLTPLKLNIQYLESKVRMDPDSAADLIEQIAPSLIEQIDNLSQIASEFSNFAQLPTARNEKVRLNEIVRTVHDFFRKREDLDFQLFVPINDVIVFADKNHLVRILNNVVKNAIQAIPPEREGEVIIRLFRQDENAIVQVSDNGTGIPESMHDKVFSPNFTTKSSGTGLGLAISANMLESCNGQIYFKTIEHEGTDFFIEIPLMRLEDNYPETNRVVLD